MLPIVGDAIGKGGKIARAAIKHGDEVLEAAGKQVDEVLESLLLRTQDVEASSSQQVGDTSNPVFRVSRKKHPNHARMLESYNTSPLEKQPCVMIYPGFLDLRLFDRLYENEVEITQLSDIDKVLTLLIDGPKSIKELQSVTRYKSRSRFLEEVINPLIESGKIFREGSKNSPKSVFKIKK